MTNNFDIHEWRLKQALSELSAAQMKIASVAEPKDKITGADFKVLRNKKVHEQPDKKIHGIKQLKEDDWMQADDEADMAHSQLYNIKKLSTDLCDMIGKDEQLDAWVQAKLTKAEDYLQSVYGYLYGEEAYNQKMTNPPKNIILGDLNEVKPNDLQIGKSYKYTGTTPSGKNNIILTFKGIKKYKDGKDHYYFIDDHNTGALFSHNDIINNLTSID